MKPKLTIGMATYDDFDGVFFSIQAIRMYHKEILNDIEFIIVDNNPGEDHGNSIKNFTNQITSHTPVKYIEAGEWKSTAVRDMVFTEATTPYVLCMDSHVLLEPESLAKLIQYYKEYPDTNDLLQGPMLYDDLKSPVTHMDPVWRHHMHGIWATNKLGIKPWAAPFEIPMHGMGLFTCRKDAWLGFNKKFKGFGGEEGYIHEKYRQAGHKTLCLPFLRWNHRFERPNGVKYRLDLTDRVWNYFVGHIENGLDVQPVIDHFNDHLDPKAVQGIYNNVRHFMETDEDKTAPRPITREHCPSDVNIKVDEDVDNATGEILRRTEGTLCYGEPVPGKRIGTVYINEEPHPVYGDGFQQNSIKVYTHNHIYERSPNQ